MANSITNELDASVRMPKWQIFTAMFFSLMIPLSLYQRDWMGVCFASARVLLIFQRKETQMPFPVKVLWVVAMFGLMALSLVFFFKKILSHGR